MDIIGVHLTFISLRSEKDIKDESTISTVTGMLAQSPVFWFVLQLIINLNTCGSAFVHIDVNCLQKPGVRVTAISVVRLASYY